jgi:1,4-alpha-glucan branching enzyme
MLFLMLANDVIHSINPDAITIAEDVSGYPTLCRTLEEGGIGFDYRLSMFIPDMWIKHLKEMEDSQWSLGSICYNLANRRWKEKCVAYCESHDQAIVGDKTISMWLFDTDIYTNMSVHSKRTSRVDRGVAFHKMLRLITMGLGGEAYLNFMGNEFGHPEWIDFPREGNGNSYHHCRRLWQLGDSEELRYYGLKMFDKALNALETKFNWLSSPHQFITFTDDKEKLLAFERGDLLFVFNFHYTKSFTDYKVGTKWASEHMIVLETDMESFSGHDRLKDAHNKLFPILKTPYQKRDNFIQLYLPSRSAMVLCAKENFDKYDIKTPA